MFDALSRFDPSDVSQLREALHAHLQGVLQHPRGDRSLVSRTESAVQCDPSACFVFDETRCGTLTAGGQTFRAGRFETPTIADLVERARQAKARAPHPSPTLRLHVFDGVSPATDIGALQALAPPESLFQVASQFNCLEAPAPCIVPVSEYFEDSTQGPRASISAFPGSLLRHYAAPGEDGKRFVQQNEGRQINLLGSICSPDVAAVQCGYLMPPAIVDPPAFARALEKGFTDLQVGIHDDIDVVFGCNWLGPVPAGAPPRIAQALTSTIAAGLYGHLQRSDATMLSIVRQLQRAAYAGTLLAAASLGKSYVVLTLIGGGVFGNPVSIIWESIVWAVDLVTPLLHKDMCVIVNGHSMEGRIALHEVCDAANMRRGALSVFAEDSVHVCTPGDGRAS